MTYPLNKYKFIEHSSITSDGKPTKEIIAISTYAGKVVKGRAKCASNDTYDFEKGKELAGARCNQKVCAKRVKRAEKKLSEAAKELQKAKRKYNKMVTYFDDATNALSDATVDLDYLLKQM